MHLLVAVTTRATDLNATILHLTVAPRYVVLLSHIDHIRFQCYANGLPAKEGQTMWTREDEVVPCNTSKRVFACVNTLIITYALPQDGGQYKCISKDNNRNFYTASVLGSQRVTQIDKRSSLRFMLQCLRQSPALEVPL